MSVDYSLNTADHLPLYMEIASQRVPEVEIVNGVYRSRRLAWDKINHTAQMEYCKETDANMQRIHIPYDALRCTDVNCKNVYIICSQRNCRKSSKLKWFYVYGFS